MTTYYIVSGGYDPIHEGHIENIIESRENSDGVIALINSDAWLCRKKGKNFMSFHTRKTIVENIKGVVEAIAFNDDDGSACDGLRLAREKYPDAKLVFAKGGDRNADNIPEVATCKEYNIEIRYNIGTAVSGQQKPNSSSWLLNEWSKNSKK
jgi:D-beta-D-heptose 7-phosphate kinase/D-beta-D-heptose 1-phosphate adenosyltransferase